MSLGWSAVVAQGAEQGADIRKCARWKHTNLVGVAYEVVRAAHRDGVRILIESADVVFGIEIVIRIIGYQRALQSRDKGLIEGVQGQTRRVIGIRTDIRTCLIERDGAVGKRDWDLRQHPTDGSSLGNVS